MKLNFWQILGIIILIVGIVLLVQRRTARNDTTIPATMTTTP
jgi:hypothetical protein